MILNSSLPSTEVPSAKIRNSRNLGTFYFASIAPNDWTAPQNDGLWQGGAKTLFDPCPAGWRVPKSGEGTESPWNAFGMNAYAAPFYYYINGVKQTAAGIPAFVFSPNNGRLYDRENGDPTSWYPTPGFRDAGGNGLFGALGTVSYDGYSWSALVSDTGGMSLGFGSTYINSENTQKRGHGFSVRCLRE